MRLGNFSWWLCAALVAFGCDSGSETPNDDAGTMTADTGSGGGSDTGTSGPQDAGMTSTGDGNDSFAEAVALVPGMTDMQSAEAAIEVPNDHDYFSFEGTQGDWVAISTSANSTSDADAVDTVIALYDSSMTKIGENDDRQPRSDPDSEIIFRVPETGTYYVEVLEFSEWNGSTAEGMASFTYRISILDFTMLTPAPTVDAEGGDDAASAQEALYNRTRSFGRIAGDFNDETDVDVYSFRIDTGRPNANFHWMVSGATGNGSTATPGRMWITNEMGTEIVARLSVGEELVNLQPNLAGGNYLFWIDRGASTGGNDFYLLKNYFSTDNPPETQEMENNMLATPEVLTMAADESTMSNRAFVLSTLAESDVDHFQVEVAAGQALNVYCGSRTAGSGITDLQATILNPDGTTVAMATETETESLAIRDQAVSPGTYIVRLSRGAQLSDVTGNWVRCGFVAAAPSM